MTQQAKPPVGGGIKKVLYTLNTVRQIGVTKSAKALSAKNTCKACGLGMGGQKGGMTNELDEFPSVCNKSIQAQLTDIQPAIPNQVFQHTLAELQELSGKEIESLGRLNTPLYKAKNANKFEQISWDKALDLTVERFKKANPKKSFFYSSGRSSNEAAFVLQLMARMYGSSNINNCSYYCHQATGVGLGSTIGTGTATVELADLGLADLIFVIGANPASNHPRFIHQLKACRDRGGDVVVINPAKEAGLVRFAVPKQVKSLISGGDWIASDYLQPNIGTDIAVFKGIAKYLLENKYYDLAFIEKYTSGFSDYVEDIKNTSWHTITEVTGLTQRSIEQVAERYAQSKNTVFAWGMGITHHLNGVQNVESIAALALLRGMIGKPGAGLLPLRGHSNVQGVGTMGVKPVLDEDIMQRIEQAFGINLARSAGMDTLACLQAAAKGNLDVALIMGGNLYQGSPDSQWAERALANIPFKVYLTTTLNLGHVYGLDNSEALIFPVTARDEEWQATTQESMFNFVRMSEGGIHRLNNVRPELNILADLADKLLNNKPFEFSRFKTHKNLRAAIAEIIPGMKALADIDVAKQEFHILNRIKHSPEFSTDDGLAKFIKVKMPQRLAGTFSLMTTRSEGQFNSIIYEEHDSYRNIPHRWAVMMNAEDMKRLNIKQGAKVDLSSQSGEMKCVEVFEFDLPEGNLIAYFPEANVLVGQAVDPRSKTPAFKNIAVTVKACLA